MGAMNVYKPRSIILCSHSLRRATEKKMSKLPIILCIVLFASVANTWNWNIRGRAPNCCNSAIESLINEVKSQYNDANKEATKILAKLESGAPIRAGAPKKPKEEIISIRYPLFLKPIWYPYSDPIYNRANKCYGYLENRLSTSKLIVDECSRIQFQLGTDYTDVMKQSADEALSQLEEYRATKCGYGENSRGFLNIFPAFWCSKKVKLDLPRSISTSISTFLNLSDVLKKLLDDYITDVGYCVANKERPQSIREWIKACQT